MQEISMTQRPLEGGLDRKQLKQLEQRFMRINQARLERALGALPARQRIFLNLLPLLWHSNHPMLPGYVSSDTPCGVCNYKPSRSEVKQVQGLARSFTFQRQPNNECDIVGLFLMGSCGTIAHSSSSDLDIWLCYRPGLLPSAIDKLKQKAELLSQWADSLGLEAHFFPMDHDDFRSGKRHGLSGEDCGSAQHYLLLDEFYRTALLIAGANPLWWFVPPTEEPRYGHFAHQIVSKRFIRPESVVDFGGITEFPAGEFVGAGIWQLYKAIESPYKSVIKILLTEVYASEYPEVESLSVAFKKAVYGGEDDIDELDPYIQIYRKIETYLTEREEHQRLELVRRCLYFKINKPLSKPPAMGKKSWQRRLLERLTESWGWDRRQLASLDARRKWKVNRVESERKVLVSELIYSYRFLTQFARANKSTALINSQEMNILGRKLYASFERKANKIDLVNPGISKSLVEDYLAFHYAHDRPSPYWEVYDHTWRADETPEKAPLKRARHLFELLIWCHFNQMIDAATRLSLIQGEHSQDEHEVQCILHTLEQQFEQSLTHTPHDHFVKRSKLLSVAIYINIGIDPMAAIHQKGLQRITSHTDALAYSGLRENLMHTIDLVALNSWHEVTVEHYGQNALVQCIEAYLQQAVKQRRRLPQLAVHCFCKDRGSAIETRIRELFDDISYHILGNPNPTSARYILQIQDEFYVFQIIDKQVHIQRLPSEATLLKYLEKAQHHYSPIVLDRHALPHSLLRCIVENSNPTGVQVYYFVQKGRPQSLAHKPQQDTVQIYVVDERGSLFVTELPFYDSLSLINPLYQFLQSTYYRQVGDATFNLDFDEQYEVQFLELSAKTSHPNSTISRGFQLQPRRPSQRKMPGQFFYVQAIAELDDSDDIHFNIYCNNQEFTHLEYGEQLYGAVAKNILQHRRGGQAYPCYITDLDLSHCIDSNGAVQTCHYLRHKTRIESALNRALQKLARKVG